MFAGLLVTLCLIAPVSAPIARPFVAPACPYCPGRRTIEFEIPAYETVRAPVTGVVHFAGAVAGRRYVTIRVGDHLVTVGGLGSIDPGVTRSRAVALGRSIGRTGESGGPVSLSVRVGTGANASTEAHVDPTPMLGRLVPATGRARLVPVDGTPRRAGPRPRAVCRRAG